MNPSPLIPLVEFEVVSVYYLDIKSSITSSKLGDIKTFLGIYTLLLNVRVDLM